MASSKAPDNAARSANSRRPSASTGAPSRSGPGGKSADAPAPRPPPFDLKKLMLRVGVPIAVLWVIALLARHWVAYTVVGVITLAALGLVGFLLRFTRRNQRVASIVSGAQTPEERKTAMDQIDREFKKDDSAAIFAKAQLQMQEDPRAALETLQTIDLQKVMANVADETRAQRAMLHLLLGEPQPARVLCDAIDLSRHQDRKAKATIASVLCEAWGRTGQAKRASEILELFDVTDTELAEVRPGLLRAHVFVYAALDDLKKARSAMHQLAKVDPRIVTGFAQKGMHPLLVQEAKKILDRAGLLPRQSVRPARSR